MNYIVTGGAGFIGSHLVDELLRQGHKIRIIDNLSAGKRENLNPRAQFFNVNIKDYKKIKPLFSGADGVFHLAAVPNVQYSIENPIATNEVNIGGTINVLMAVRENNIRRIVFSSSSSVYGDAKTLPTNEETLLSPKSPYALQKLVGEKYCELFSKLYCIETIYLRYFNVYGQRMTDTGAYVTVISVFLKQSINGEPLTITGDGTQTRDFVHVNDVVKANILAMENNNIKSGEAINIGSGENCSVNRIASLFDAPIKYIPPRIEPHDTMAEIKKANNLLGWFPSVQLENGIKELINANKK